MFTNYLATLLTITALYAKINCPKWDKEVYMNELQLIRNLFLFKNIDFDQLDLRYSIIKNTISVSYNSGDIILSKGDDPVGIGVVVSGNALISTAVQSMVVLNRNKRI